MSIEIKRTDDLYTLHEDDRELVTLERHDLVKLRDDLNAQLATDTGLAARVANSSGVGVIGLNAPTHYERTLAGQTGADVPAGHLPAIDPEATLRKQEAEAGGEHPEELSQVQAQDREHAEEAAHENAESHES